MSKNKSNYTKKSNNYYRNGNKTNKKNNLSSTGRLNLNDLEATTRIRIDDDRLNDTASLDTSFLEGRFSKNKKKNNVKESKKVKYSNMENRKKNTRIDDVPKKKIINKSMVISIFLIVIISLLILFGGFCIYNVFINNNDKVKNKVVTKEVVKIVNDENILFLGDSITEFYDLDKYYKDYHVVNSGINGNRCSNILDNMYERVYRYNPSKVFLLIGTNDIIDHKDDMDKFYNETSENITKIIKEIKENRKYAKIYVESIYPINDTDNDKIDHSMVDCRKNDIIRKMNEKIKEIAEKEEITYIDLYDKLVDDEGNLKIEYTKEGLHISDEGYEFITNELLKYINDEK